VHVWTKLSEDGVDAKPLATPALELPQPEKGDCFMCRNGLE